MSLEDRKARAELLTGREVRRAPMATLELREQDGGLNLSGIASVTDRGYDMGFYQETVKRGAFTKTLSEMPDVQLLIGHEGLPLARTTSGTLQLRETHDGLSVDAQLDPNDPDVQRLAPKMQRGDVNEMSFAFRVVRQTWDENYENREISEVSINRGDGSVVGYGANPFTAASLRSAFSDLAGLSDEELDAWRDDPTVITIVRRLAIPATTITVDQSTEQAATAHDLTLYQARARALALRIL